MIESSLSTGEQCCSNKDCIGNIKSKLKFLRGCHDLLVNCFFVVCRSIVSIPRIPRYKNSHGGYVSGSVSQMILYHRCIPCIPIQSGILWYYDICVSVAETRSSYTTRQKVQQKKKSVFCGSVLELGQVLHDPPENPNLPAFLGSGLCDPIRYCRWTILYSRVLFCNLPINLELFPKATNLLFLYGFQHMHALLLYTIHYMFNFDWIKDVLCYLLLFMTWILKYLEVYIWYLKYFGVYIWCFKSYIFFCLCILQYTIQYMIQKSGRTIHDTYPDLTTMSYWNGKTKLGK